MLHRATMLVVLAAACGSAPGGPGGSFWALPFHGVAQGELTGPGPERPILYVAREREDLEGFLDLVAPTDIGAVGQADLSSNVVLAVFGGQTPSSGYRVTVRQVFLDRGRFRVVVTVRAPAPDEYVLPAFSSAYHVVEVSREAIGEAVPSSWTLVDSTGRVMGSGRD